jgi:hypothetical protein
MQVTDEMIEAALKQAPKFWRDYDSSADQMRAVIEAALAAMWRRGDDMYSLEGEVLGFWKSKEPDLIGEFGITAFNGDVWVNPDDDSDPFRSPDAVMQLPQPLKTKSE